MVFIPYDKCRCRNLEWQVCAAKGRLPGQQGRPLIRFAESPKRLDLSEQSTRPLGRCGGWHPAKAPSRGMFGYTNNDIFFLEVCIFATICYNGDHIFDVEAGGEFLCEFSPAGFWALRRILQQPLEVDTQAGMKCWDDPLTHEVKGRG